MDTAKNELKTQFKMTDLGEVHHILGLCILQTSTKTSINQTHYIQNILKKNQMENCTHVNTPMESNIRLIPLAPNEEGHNVQQYQSIIGVFNYTVVLTRPNITTAIRFLT